VAGPSGGAFWRAWSTPLRLPRMVATFGWSGPRAPRRSPASAHPVLLHLPGTAGGRDARYRAEGQTSTWTPARTAVQDGHPGLACWTARADTPADGHRGRPHAGRVPLVVCSHPSGRVGRGVPMTNDSSPPWAAVRPGVRVVSSRPGRERPSRPPWCACWSSAWPDRRPHALGASSLAARRCSRSFLDL
jgi:hypothetical protein